MWNPHESISVKLVTTCWFGGHGREAIESLKRFLINESVGGKVWFLQRCRVVVFHGIRRYPLGGSIFLMRSVQKLSGAVSERSFDSGRADLRVPRTRARVERGNH